MNRKQRAKIAEETLQAIDKGYYRNPQGEEVVIEDSIKRAVEGTKLYRPKEFSRNRKERQEILSDRNLETRYGVFHETTLQGARKLQDKYLNSPFCLNFASAKNPGGGFRQGSEAQEESLARSSGLYPCLKSQMDYYRENEKFGSSLYTDHMIYSPDVPVIKNDKGEFLKEPYPVSFLTAPAVNRSALESNEPGKVDLVPEVMGRRIERVLTVAVLENHRNLVLGAWGCGVFGNSPGEIAALFGKRLKDGTFSGAFGEVRFSVYDPGREEVTYQAFKDVFG